MFVSSFFYLLFLILFKQQSEFDIFSTLTLFAYNLIQ